MKTSILVLTLSLLAASSFAGTPMQSAAPAPIDPNKLVTFTLPLRDTKAVLDSLFDSAVVSARDANRISQSIVSQVQPQVAPASAPAKK
jgi:hypothetical protein